MLRSVDGTALKKMLRSVDGTALKKMLRSVDGTALKKMLRSVDGTALKKMLRSVDGAALKKMLRSVDDAALKKMLRSVDGAALKKMLRSVDGAIIYQSRAKGFTDTRVELECCRKSDYKITSCLWTYKVDGVRKDLEYHVPKSMAWTGWERYDDGQISFQTRKYLRKKA
ncbi:hypothetical protein RRG08_006341 [Elysia crispata]|uniref:Uncharacterized protein n=1 Tax=Elysia crispata TaxID=231223 RepID=A0AAE1D2F0_9GAST|nr:hypothetical protein RRG08_006341 [Elysia crispata]